jgi:hypothetical protein
VTRPKTACKLRPAVSGEEHKSAAAKAWQRYAFAAIPIAGLLELGAHVVQVHSVAPDADWQAAREYVSAHAAPDDLVAFAPRWIDPVGREQFGSHIANLQREARGDVTRFPRAFEVSVRGKHLDELAGWTREGAERFGGVTVTTWKNPAPVTILDDLVSHVDPQHMRVSRVDGARESECAFGRQAPSSGGLGFGPATPSERFACPGGGTVSSSVVTDLDYYPHRCIFAPAIGGNATVRLRFADVPFGHALRGHHSLYVEHERKKEGPPVTITFRVGDTTLGSIVHHDGDGWRPFELDTSAFAGQRGELVAEIASPSGQRRSYCFEASTQ